MASIGYSGTPLAKKLGIKEGFSLRVVNPPKDYFEFFEDLPENLTWSKDSKGSRNLVHYFTKKIADLEKDIIDLRREIFPDGTLWISWPKKTSGVVTDVSEDRIRKIALNNGLVDVKVCAVDNLWSGLKLVVPVKERNT